MKCPRCKVTMKADSIQDVSFTVETNKCPDCEGIWFKKGELSKLDRIVEPIMLEIRKIPNKNIQLKALNCPMCDNLQLMHKADHHRDNEVIIDYCPVCHGIWLDKGELEAIQKEDILHTVSKLYRWLTSNE